MFVQRKKICNSWCCSVRWSGTESNLRNGARGSSSMNSLWLRQSTARGSMKRLCATNGTTLDNFPFDSQTQPQYGDRLVCSSAERCWNVRRHLKASRTRRLRGCTLDLRNGALPGKHVHANFLRGSVEKVRRAAACAGISADFRVTQNKILF